MMFIDFLFLFKSLLSFSESSSSTLFFFELFILDTDAIADWLYAFETNPNVASLKLYLKIYICLSFLGLLWRASRQLYKSFNFKEDKTCPR